MRFTIYFSLLCVFVFGSIFFISVDCATQPIIGDDIKNTGKLLVQWVKYDKKMKYLCGMEQLSKSYCKRYEKERVKRIKEFTRLFGGYCE